MDFKIRINCTFLILSGLVITAVYSQDRTVHSQVGSVPSKFSSFQKPKPADQLTTPDKAQHFMGSLISTVLFCKIFQDPLQIDKSKSKIIAVGITLGLGISKELHDSTRSKGMFSWKDLLADMAGITAGLILVNQP